MNGAVFVWILVFTAGGYRESAPAVIDNIATQAECERVQRILNEGYPIKYTRCVQVQKLRSQP